MSAARVPLLGFLPLLALLALLIPALSPAAGAGAPADLEDGLLVLAIAGGVFMALRRRRPGGGR